MAMEDIQTVIRAEQEGRQLYEQAAIAARQAVTQAEQAGRKRVEAACRDAQRRVKELLAQVEQETAAEMERMLDEVRESCGRLIRDGRQHLEQAAARIAEKVVNG